jgi:hypothetical protein
MLKEAIEKIQALVSEAARVDHHEFYHQTFVTKPLVKMEVPRAEPLVVHTLRGVLHYLTQNRDSLTLDDVVVHVEDFNRVRVLDSLNNDRRREEVLCAKPLLADGVSEFLNRYTDSETFVVRVQQMFRDSETRAKLLAAVGNITVGAVNTFVDDGVTQEVTTKQSGAKVAVVLPNPVLLSPMRTFPEIVLDEVPYVLRAKPVEGGVAQLALFEADGGRWRLDAIEKIAKFLLDNRGPTPEGESAGWGVIA